MAVIISLLALFFCSESLVEREERIKVEVQVMMTKVKNERNAMRSCPTTSGSK